uniref:Small ribosomal subunit protein uS15c n=1 Tax=Erodium gruinum TaxID=337380 RepID=G0YQL9_9ROSI|nr:ribosomal protein S15 [Erodium gruinum]YP_009111622.1 ribosomal protein S15 [Erodium gruinum]AEK20870.1 ribosomal protein S15 [Erodium gruinum]AHH80587.1 ribosomal protein S15 [Erodium gruinum]AHH80634.1 ribosomal protein S15 [Erodium gruinum]
MVSKEKKETNSRGSIEFQVFSFTTKINKIASHLQLHKTDFLSERGLHKLLTKRERLLCYLSKKNPTRYLELRNVLDIQESRGDSL